MLKLGVILTAATVTILVVEFFRARPFRVESETCSCPWLIGRMDRVSYNPSHSFLSAMSLHCVVIQPSCRRFTSDGVRLQLFA